MVGKRRGEKNKKTRRQRGKGNSFQIESTPGPFWSEAVLLNDFLFLPENR